MATLFFITRIQTIKEHLNVLNNPEYDAALDSYAF